MKKLFNKIWVYLRPFCNWKFLISYFIPFMLVNGWAWIGAFLTPIIGLNWFTISATTWLGILWLPCTPEKLITIPIAIWIFTKLFKNDPKTKNQLDKMYAEAKKDWEHIKMKLKPKKTTLNPRALLYKRYTDIQISYDLSIRYKTNDNKYWVFDSQTLSFIETTANTTPIIVGENDVFKFQDTCFKYYNGWQVVEQSTATALKYGNIGKYQTNKYYFAGSFSYVVSGAIQDTTTQVIKGNIAPLQSLDIQYTDDSIKMSQDDLVVIENRLYSVENPTCSRIYQPKKFNIYFATLNNIL